jgi:hypothetical protein
MDPPIPSRPELRPRRRRCCKSSRQRFPSTGGAPVRAGSSSALAEGPSVTASRRLFVRRWSCGSVMSLAVSFLRLPRPARRPLHAGAAGGRTSHRSAFCSPLRARMTVATLARVVAVRLQRASHDKIRHPLQQRGQHGLTENELARPSGEVGNRVRMGAAQGPLVLARESLQALGALTVSRARLTRRHLSGRDRSLSATFDRCRCRRHASITTVDGSFTAARSLRLVRPCG